jgi:hypothetical protein
MQVIIDINPNILYLPLINPIAFLGTNEFSNEHLHFDLGSRVTEASVT